MRLYNAGQVYTGVFHSPVGKFVFFTWPGIPYYNRLYIGPVFGWYITAGGNHNGMAGAWPRLVPD